MLALLILNARIFDHRRHTIEQTMSGKDLQSSRKIRDCDVGDLHSLFLYQRYVAIILQKRLGIQEYVDDVVP
jgi:hypothetical protein